MCYSFLSDPATIALQSLGVIDVAANDVQDNEILAYALHNETCSEKQEAWAVRCGNEPVNEYACQGPDSVHTDGSGENPNHLLGSFPCLFPYRFGGFEVDRPH